MPSFQLHFAKTNRRARAGMRPDAEEIDFLPDHKNVSHLKRTCRATERAAQYLMSGDEQSHYHVRYLGRPCQFIRKVWLPWRRAGANTTVSP